MFFFFENVFSRLVIDSFGQPVSGNGNGLESLTESAISAPKLAPRRDEPMIGYFMIDLTKICKSILVPVTGLCARSAWVPQATNFCLLASGKTHLPDHM